jgi:hypothetical protein
MKFRKTFIVKKPVPFLFKSVKSVIFLYFLFGCFCPVFPKSNGTEVIAWRLNPESDIRGYRVYCGESSSSYSRLFEAGSGNLFDLSALQPGRRYFCAVTAVDEAGNESAFSEEISFMVGTPVVSMSRITAVFPNPFRQHAAIWTVLSDSSDTFLSISDVAGRRVRTVHSGPLTAGAHGFVWDGRDDAGAPAASGLYIATLGRGARVQSRKLTLIR